MNDQNTGFIQQAMDLDPDEVHYWFGNFGKSDQSDMVHKVQCTCVWLLQWMQATLSCEMQAAGKPLQRW